VSLSDAEVATASAPHTADVGEDHGRGGVLRQWPAAAYLRLDYSEFRCDRRGAVAILDGDGEVLVDDLEACGPRSTTALTCTS